MTKFTKQIY